ANPAARRATATITPTRRLRAGGILYGFQPSGQPRSRAAPRTVGGWRSQRLVPPRHDSSQAAWPRLAAAQREGIRVIGHVPFSGRIEDAMRGGHYSVEHLLEHDRAAFL